MFCSPAQNFEWNLVNLTWKFLCKISKFLFSICSLFYSTIPRGDRLRDFFSSMRNLINNDCKYSNSSANKYSTIMFNAYFNCFSVLVIIYLSQNLKVCILNEWLSSNFCNFPFYILLIDFSEHCMRDYYYLHLKKKIVAWEKLLCMKTKYCILLFFLILIWA